MVERKRIVFIVNPVSGTTAKKKVLKLSDTKVDRKVYDFDIVRTEYVGHATELARNAAKRGVDVVCAIGGDGTVNETARGLIHTQTALAIIPQGSGNGLARHLHIPTDPEQAIKIINKGLVIDMDYGLVNHRPFFCTCGVGFDAFISQKFAEAGKRGPLTYIENVLNNGLTYNPEIYDLELINTQDGKEERHVQKAYVISCANASQYGNNAYIAPDASVCDGLMDVTVMEPFTAIEAPAIALQLFTGDIDRNSRIKTFRCQRAIIRRRSSGAIHYDGDPVEEEAIIEVSIVPAGIKCVYPGKEGKMDFGESIQSLLSEHFRNIYAKSEEIIQSNLRKSQRITQLNVDIIRKLSKK